MSPIGLSGIDAKGHSLACTKFRAATCSSKQRRKRLRPFVSYAIEPRDAQVSIPEDVARLTERIRSAQRKRLSVSQEKDKAPLRSRPAKKPCLSDKEILSFERQGHLTTRSLIPREDLHNLAKEVRLEVHRRKLEALKHRVRVLCPSSNPFKLTSVKEAMEELDRWGTEPVGFLQFFNLWRTRSVVWVIANQLASVAADLLGCKKLRLYQDCAFLKEPGFSETNWHSDLRMTPLDTNHFVTAWIPLRSLQGPEDSGLIFASGSHRDFALPFWHHGSLEDMDLTSRGYPLSRLGAMSLGDVSWHSGWTLHTAPGQPQGSSTRLALSISYFKDGARLLPKRAAAKVQLEDQESFQQWRSELKDGSVAKHQLLPLLDL